MTSLEIIKDELEWGKENLDNPIDNLDREDAKWLIKQAEKVEQLEKDKDNLSKLLVNTLVADVELMNEFIPNWKLNAIENIEKLLSALK